MAHSTVDPPQLASDLVYSSCPSLTVDIAYHVAEEICLGIMRPGFLETLRSMALSCKGLYKVASKYLYADLTIFLICINADNFLLKSEQVLKEFHEILIKGLDFPGLAMVYHLQAVEFCIHFSNLEDLRPLSLIPAFREVFDTLQGKTHGIASLKFGIQSPRHHGPYPIMMGQFFDRQFCESFVALCRSPTLRNLRLERTGLNPGALCGAHIENLHLEHFGLSVKNREHMDKDDAQYRGPPLRLKSLALLNVMASSTPQVTELIDLFHPPLMQDSSLLMSSAFSQITSLVLFNYIWVQINLDLFPRLRSLTVVQWNFVKGDPHHRYDMFSVHNSARCLQSFFLFGMQSLGTVVDLTIIINLHGKVLQLIADNPEARWYTLTLQEWVPTDTHLAASVSVLERIRFVFNITSRLTKGDLDGVKQDKRLLQTILLPKTSEMAGSKMSLEIVDAESRDLIDCPSESTAHFEISRNSPPSRWDESTFFFRVSPEGSEVNTW